VERAPRVAFVYPNPRLPHLAEIEAGLKPDTRLWGQNHLAAFGVEAHIHDPALRRRERRAGLLHRVTWNARELTLPWEVRDADVVVTSLATLFPLAARTRRGLRVAAMNFSLCTRFDRSSRAGRRALRASLGSAWRVVCLARAQRERLLGQMPLDPERVTVAQVGVDERFWHPLPPAPEGYVLAVGKDLARDYGTFFEAVRGLDRPVVVVTAQRNLEGLVVPPNVETRLEVPFAELRELYAGAACIVIPTRDERYPYGAEGSGTLALLNAMASAKPVVITERPERSDYLEPGQTALTVPPEDPEVLRAAIEEVVSDAELARRLGEAARRRVEAEHTTTRFAERLAAILADTS
jgi:glycosyltransferase involved in cell wall biosynthesis